MRNFTLIFSLLIFPFLSFAQQVQRNYVLVEIATGDWCSWCPGAALAADDLIENGDPAAIIENHYNDTFETNDSKSRIIDYYGINSYPTSHFDGSYDTVIGGAQDTSVYAWFKPIVDARILMDSDFTLDIYGENDGDDYSTYVHVQNLGGYDGDNIALRYTLTESHIEYSWKGLDEMNFANRLMVPDHNGIDLSQYDLSEETIIDVDFTFNNSWDAENCELVLFIQDDDTQEVLQSYKIALNDLYIPITVDFEADATSGCDGTVVNFTDLSVGEGTISYQWTFEGGTPETSNEQNPTVTYNSGGYFNVELTATDENSTGTYMIPNYIWIEETPAQPESPEGDSQVCNNSEAYYTVAYVDFADDWEWELEPATAGILAANDQEATLTPTTDWTGDFTLRVRASSDCGTGEWSDPFEGSIQAGPEIFTIEGGGPYCFDGDGSEITLNGSETGISYELFLSDTATNLFVEGTGSPISFGMQTDTGFYSVQADNNFCSIIMSGQAEVSYLFPPDSPEMPDGDELVCNDLTTTYTTIEIDDAYDYNWSLDPTEAGTINSEGVEAEITWNEDFSGMVQLTVSGMNDCGEGIYSEALVIQVDDCTDVAELSLENHLNIFPNPASGTLNISCITQTNGRGKLKIYNHVGQLQVERTINFNAEDLQEKIDVSKLRKGLYLLNIQFPDNKVLNTKLVKN